MFLSVGRLGAACNTVSSNTYSEATKKNWKIVKGGVDSPYYDATCKCFKEGYKPEPYYSLMGVAPHVESGDPWLVCKPVPTVIPTRTTTSCPVCKSCPTCPTCPKCPTCTQTACPTPEPCPQCPKCESAAPLAKPQKSIYGPTLGLLIAVVVIGGGGYYAYKKGAFGGKRKR